MKSRSEAQLRGDAGVRAARLETACVPRSRGQDDGPALPCGLVAWSVFNDTFQVSGGIEGLKRGR